MKKLGIAILSILLVIVIVYQFFPSFLLSTHGYFLKKQGHFAKETVALNGDNYYYLDNNRENKPTVVLLHGYSDRKESWLPFVNKISKDYRIILLDLLGHGDNNRDFKTSHDFVTQANFVNDITSELNLDKFDVIGISMGGGVAGQFAANFKEKTNSLTLISTAGINDYATPSKMDELMVTKATLEQKKDEFPLLPHKVTKSSLGDFKQYLFYKNMFIPLRLFKVYLNNTVENRDFYIKVLEDFLYADVNVFKNPLNDVLPEIECPINVIWGKQDPLLSSSCVNVITDILDNNLDVTVIDNCGHATIAEQPKETLIAVTTFLDKIHQKN